MQKVGIITGAVLLLSNFVVFYSPSTGGRTFLQSETGQLMAFGTAGLIWFGLALYVLPQRPNWMKWWVIILIVALSAFGLLLFSGFAN